MYTVIEVDGIIKECKKEHLTFGEAINYCEKHSYKGMSFHYRIVSEDNSNEVYLYTEDERV